jgi:hypothetical protein
MPLVVTLRRSSISFGPGRGARSLSHAPPLAGPFPWFLPLAVNEELTATDQNPAPPTNNATADIDVTIALLTPVKFLKVVKAGHFTKVSDSKWERRPTPPLRGVAALAPTFRPKPIESLSAQA